MNVIKRFVFALVILLVAMPASAGTEDIQTEQEEKITLSTKVPISFYGFISAETMYSDSQLSSFGTDNNTPASYNRNMAGFNRVVDESIDGNNDGFLSWTVQNTRFGFRLDSYNFGGKNFEVDARLEMDFFSTANMSVSAMRPRIRHANVGIGQKRWHVLFGQYWDLFSPLNTATLNIGGNLWRQGNLGYRHPQIRFTFKQPLTDKDGLKAAASVSLPSDSMSFTDAGVTTCVPMLQGLFGYWRDMSAGKLQAYLSAVYARHNNAVANADDINNWGLALSLEVPIHKYLIATTEFHYGYSLGQLLMLSNSSDRTRQRSIAAWGQIKSLWLNWFETNLGYGIDDVNKSQVANGWITRNQMGFASLRFKPHHAFIIGLEYNFLRTNYQGSAPSNANVGLLNVIYFF